MMTIKIGVSFQDVMGSPMMRLLFEPAEKTVENLQIGFCDRGKL